MESEPDNYYFPLFFLFVPLIAIPSGVIFAIIFVVFLLACSALISSSEVAFFSLTINDLEKITQENSAVTQRILYLKETPRKLLATILIANNFINIAIVILSQYILDTLIYKDLTDIWAKRIIEFTRLNISEEWLSGSINFLITIVGVTFLLVLFGEVAPKIYAKLNNVRLAKFMSKTLLFLYRLFHPISRLLVTGTNIIEKRLVNNSINGSSSRREDIDQAIELTVKDDKHAEHEIDILKGIVKFGEVSSNKL